jgi:hypothetical protein
LIRLASRMDNNTWISEGTGSSTLDAGRAWSLHEMTQNGDDGMERLKTLFIVAMCPTYH